MEGQKEFKDGLQLLRQDANFLLNPLFVLDKRKGKTSYLSPDGKFFLFLTASETIIAGEKMEVDGLMTFLDNKIHLYLLYLAQKNNSPTVKTSLYKIAKFALGYENISSQFYRRILKSLVKLRFTGIEFKDHFYDGKAYTTKGFQLVSELQYNSVTNEVTVTFSEAYFNQVKESEYFRRFSFVEYRNLSHPLSARLYEILLASPPKVEFLVKTLLEKLIVENKELYLKRPSKFYQLLKQAVEEINEKTYMNVKLQVEREKGRGGKLKIRKFIFEKEHQKKRNAIKLEDLGVEAVIYLKEILKKEGAKAPVAVLRSMSPAEFQATVKEAEKKLLKEIKNLHKQVQEVRSIYLLFCRVTEKKPYPELLKDVEIPPQEVGLEELLEIRTKMEALLENLKEHTSKLKANEEELAEYVWKEASEEERSTAIDFVKKIYQRHLLNKSEEEVLKQAKRYLLDQKYGNLTYLLELSEE